MRLTYAKIEDMLAELHDIPASRRTALEGRLKHFKRLQFPAGVNTGRGKAAAYDVAAILKILFAFELLELGLMPERAVRTVRKMWAIIPSAAGYGATFLERGEPDDLRKFEEPYDEDMSSFFVLMDPVGLSSLADPYDDGDMALKTIQTCTGAYLRERIFQSAGRLAVVNFTRLIGRAALHFRDEAGIPTREFAAALRGWADSFEFSAGPEND